MKTKILIAAVMFFALSVAAYAQATFQVSSQPVTTVAACGASELTGNVIFTAITGTGATPANGGTLVITYNVPVVTVALGSALKIVVNGVESVVDEGAATVSGSTVTMPISEAINLAGNSVVVSGIRVNVAGTGVTSVSVSVTASGTTGFAFVGGQTNLVVVNSVSAAFKPFGAVTVPASNSTVVTAASVAAFNGTITPAAVVNVNIMEGFNSAFNPGTNGQLIQFTFSAIPAGLTLTVPATTTDAPSGNGWQLVTVSGSGATFATANAAATTLTSASSVLSVYYKLNTYVIGSGNVTDTLTVPVTVGIAVTATFPLPLGTVTVTANLAPLTSPTMTYVPRYGSDQCVIGPANLVSVVASRTALLMPYALYSATPPYNTGIAIANTTTDPGGAAMGFTVLQTATPQNGAVTFYFFPQAGITGPNPFTTSTMPSSTPGSGFVSATGLVASGSTYAVNLSDLLNAAGFTGTFWQGYIIAVCNFTNGHGQYFVGNVSSGGAVFEQGALMLVLDPLQRTAPGAPEKLEN